MFVQRKQALYLTLALLLVATIIQSSSASGADVDASDHEMERRYLKGKGGKKGKGKGKKGKSKKGKSKGKGKGGKKGSEKCAEDPGYGVCDGEECGLVTNGDNICAGTKVSLPNIPCFAEIVGTIDDEALDTVGGDRFFLGTAEQSGTNVTKGYQGLYDTDMEPITNSYYMEGMCPVNVHWHLGTEHLSAGEYDENGKGPGDRRKLAADARLGFRCHHYDEADEIFTKEYDWKYCVDTHVGETYEVHWPHSNMGDCGTPNQYQTPFYDGVFCNFATTFGGSLANAKVGVQGQVFTIVNDEQYYYPDLIRGMIVDGDMGTDIAYYTGSTTGTSRDNEMCSQYTGITWQVDRKCHLISASSFDKMCKDMMTQRDSMADDLYPHGSRVLVNDQLAADNQQRSLLL